MKNQKRIEHLKKSLNHLEYYNKMSPFPIYDTDYIKDMKEEVEKIEYSEDIDYDLESVVACKYCKSLHIVYDEENNDMCMRCGSINELETFKDIFEYELKIYKLGSDEG